MTYYEIVMKLIGEVRPYGDTRIDEERLDNLNKLGELTTYLILEMIRVANYNHRHEYSIKEISEMAISKLINIKDIIEESDLEGRG